MEDEQKKTGKTILVVIAVVVGVGLAAWSGYRSLSGPKENIVGTIPAGPGGAGMKDSEMRGNAPAGQVAPGAKQ
jgi:flagellar basal body-associated protein FliL